MEWMRISHVCGGHLCTTMMQNIDKICIRGVEYHGNLDEENHAISKRLGYMSVEEHARTPIPLSTKHIALIMMESFPFVNCVAIPDTRTEHGASMMPPRRVARRRSSGTHTPPLRLRSETISLSEYLPAKFDPTGIGWEI